MPFINEQPSPPLSIISTKQRVLLHYAPILLAHVSNLNLFHSEDNKWENNNSEDKFKQTLQGDNRFSLLCNFEWFTVQTYTILCSSKYMVTHLGAVPEKSLPVYSPGLNFSFHLGLFGFRFTLPSLGNPFLFLPHFVAFVLHFCS